MMERRRALLTALVFALCLGALALLYARVARQAANQDAWNSVQQSGVLRVAMDASYPPFEWVDAEGVWRGYDVALAQAMGERWGVQVSFVDIAFDGLYDALLAGKADTIISALPFDELLTQDVLYSQPYFIAGQVIVAPASHPLAGEDALRGLRVAAELGADGHAELVRLNRDRGLGIEIVVCGTVQEAAAAVEAGQADALVCDRVDALALRAQYGFAIAEAPLTVDPYVIATRDDSSRLLREVNAALEAFEQQGLMTSLQETWLER